jgi:Zn-finger nucleic acid-binding protein
MSSLLVTCPACGYKTLTTHLKCIHCEKPLGDLSIPKPWAGEQRSESAPTPPPQETPPERIPQPELPPEPPPEEPIRPTASPPKPSLSQRPRPIDKKRNPADTVWPPRLSSMRRREKVGSSRSPQAGAQESRVASHRRGQCPRGHGPLQAATLLNRTVAHCKSCKGLWLTHSVFREFLAMQARGALEGRKSPPAKAVSLPRTSMVSARAFCPECGAAMTRRVYGDFSGILIDVCERHGVWLDDNELRAIMRYIVIAGPDFARQLLQGQ